MADPLEQLQARLQVAFRKPALLRQAFTHTSYTNEQQDRRLKDNERLEFLGDAVLQLTVSAWLYRKYPAAPEGELTRLRIGIVSEPSLVRFAERLGFGELLLLGKGEESTGGRTKSALLADAFEAFVAALYLDQGLAAVESFLEAFVLPHAADGDQPVKDFKSRLQEITQKSQLGTPDYEIVEQIGHIHDRQFVAAVSVGGRRLGSGSGRSKKDAEQQAASAAIARLDAEGQGG